MMKRTYLASFWAMIAVFAVGVGPLAAKGEPELGPKEVEIGKQAIAEITKDHKISDNAEDLKRLRAIGDKIATVANSKEIPAIYGSSRVTPFEYQFNIIEADDVNAFSVPGGFIYVYRGLLDFVQSDDELAGIIAHEICHASHHHMVYLLKKQAGLQNQLAIAMLAAIVAGAQSRDMGNIVMGVQLYQIAKLNGYGMEAEKDADNGAIIYTVESGYNPVGLLTFLERLSRRPQLFDWGIYQSHPLDADRIKAAMNRIKQLGIPINRRAVTKAIKAEVKTVQIDGAEVYEVVIDGKSIYRPAPHAAKSAEHVAQEAAGNINKALDDGVKMHELTADTVGGGVVARGRVILLFTDADAKRMGKTPGEAAKEAAEAIRKVVWKQMADTIH